MAYLGLVPSEYSSGDTQRRGAITKAGTPPARTDNRPRVVPRPGARSSASIVATAISWDTASARRSR